MGRSRVRGRPIGRPLTRERPTARHDYSGLGREQPRFVAPEATNDLLPCLHSEEAVSLGGLAAYVCLITGYYSTTVFLPALLTQLNLNPYFISFVSILGQIPGIFLISILTELPCVGRLHTVRLMTLFTVAFFLLLIRLCPERPVSGIMIYFFMVPILPLMYTILSESYPTEIRAQAFSFFNTLSASFGLAWASIRWWVSSGAGHPLAIPFHGSCSLCYSTCGSCLSEP